MRLLLLSISLPKALIISFTFPENRWSPNVNHSYRFCITTISWRRTQTKASNAPGQPHQVILLIQILLAEDFVQHVHKTGSKKQLMKFLWNPNPFVITRWCRTCTWFYQDPPISEQTARYYPSHSSYHHLLTPPFPWQAKKRTRQVCVFVFFFWDPDSIIDQVWITSFFLFI